jgi:transcriptional regulator with XRE-family HTH domain
MARKVQMRKRTRIHVKEHKLPRPAHNKELGLLLKEHREKVGITQQELADMLGYSSSQFISNFECGIYIPPLKKLRTIVHILRMDPEQVLEIILRKEKSLLEKGLVSRQSHGRASLREVG